MKRLQAALIGSAIGAIILIGVDVILLSKGLFGDTTIILGPTGIQTQSDGAEGLFVLPPLIAGIMAGVLAAQRAPRGGGKGAVAGLLAGFFLLIFQFGVEFLFIYSGSFEAVLLMIYFLPFLIFDFAVAPVVGAMAGAMTASATYKPQSQEAVSTITPENSSQTE